MLYKDIRSGSDRYRHSFSLSLSISVDFPPREIIPAELGRGDIRLSRRRGAPPLFVLILRSVEIDDRRRGKNFVTRNRNSRYFPYFRTHRVVHANKVTTLMLSYPRGGAREERGGFNTFLNIPSIPPSTRKILAFLFLPFILLEPPSFPHTTTRVLEGG